MAGSNSGIGRSTGANLRRMFNLVANGVAAAPSSRSAAAAGEDFFRGFGPGFADPKSAVRVAAPVAPRVVPKVALKDPVAASLAAGRAAAPTPISPHDRQLAALDTILRGPFTRDDLDLVSRSLPAPAKAATYKDTVLGETAKLSQQIFANQIAQAQELAETNPQAARNATAKATDALYQRNAALVGMNPLALAQAQMFGPAEED